MELSNLEKKLGYKFKNIKLLELALSHTSYFNENRSVALGDNERLEFLGDSVLSLVISNYIYNNYPDFPEGVMTTTRASTVCEGTLKKVALKIGINEYIKLGKGEEISGGRNRASILSDAVEAVIAAMYLDSDFKTCEKFILDNMVEFINESVEGHGVIDYKTKLQEILQKDGDVFIEYEVVEAIGPDHDKKFKMIVKCDGLKLAEGKGHSKKEAEQDCAKNAINTCAMR